MHLLGSYIPTSAKRDARLGWNKSTITSNLTRISEIRKGEQVMSIAINGAALASAILMLFTVDPAGGQGFPVTAPRVGIVALTPVDPNTGPTIDDVETSFIEHTKQKFKQPEFSVPVSLEPELPRMNTPSQSKSFTNLPNKFPNPSYETYQVVPPIDGAAVLNKWLSDQKAKGDSDLRDEFKEAKESDCNKVAILWSSYVSKIDTKYLPNVKGDIKLLSAKLDSEKRQDFRDAAVAYDKLCLGHPDKIPAAFVHSEYKNVVAILLANGVPFCGAFRIRQNTFVTARHCFFYKHKFGGKPIKAYEKGIKVSLLAAPQRKFAVSEKFGTPTFGVANWRLFGDLEDYLFLETEPIDINMPSIYGKMPSNSEELFLIGYYRFHQPAWIFGDPTKRGRPAEWWHGMRWTKAPLCRTGPTKDACLSHFCQTDRGFSGSGILARSAGKDVEYFGIHIGAMGFHNTCIFEPNSTAGNLGIQFNLSVAARELSQNSLEQ